MSKASELLQKLKQQRENREAIQVYWLELFPERGELKQTQVNAWLTQYDFDTIIAGLNSAVIKVNKVDHAVDAGNSSEEMTASRVIKYASMCMRNAGLTDEERQALDDKRDALRAARSAAGKKGNAKRWGEPVKGCDDLQSDATGCDVLPRYIGTVTGTGTFTDTGRDTTTGRDAASPRSSDPLEKKKKEQTKPETKTNPARASSSTANQLQDKPKTKTLKTVTGDRPKPDGFDSWSNTERVEWMNCTCGATLRQDSDGYRYLVHNGDCAVDNSGQIKGKAVGAAADSRPSLKGILGTVDEL